MRRTPTGRSALTKDLGKGFAVAIAYVDTNADKAVYTNTRGRYLGKSTFWASLTKTFSRSASRRAACQTGSPRGEMA